MTLIPLLLLPATAVLVSGLLAVRPELTGDVAYYHDVSSRLLRGELPYLDFEFEYPIVALVPMLLPHGVLPFGTMTLEAYEIVFVALNAAAAGLIGMLVVSVSRVLNEDAELQLRRFAAYALLTLIGAHLVAWRYDVTPALLSILALHAAFRGRATTAGVWLGLGVATKLYPAVMAPPIVLWQLARGQRREAARFSAAALLAAASGFVPIAVIDPDAAVSFLRFQQERGIHLESLTAGLLALASHLGWTGTGVEFAFKTYQVTSPLEPVLRWLQPLVLVGAQLALLALLSVRLRRPASAGPSTNLVLAGSAALLLAFVLTNKVLSPQHLVWLLPFMPLLAGWAVVVFGAALLLTLVLFPLMYVELIGLGLGPVLLLNARNLLLLAIGVGLVVWCLGPRRTPRTRRS